MKINTIGDNRGCRGMKTLGCPAYAKHPEFSITRFLDETFNFGIKWGNFCDYIFENYCGSV